MIQALCDFQLDQTLYTCALFKKIVLPIYTRILTFHYLNVISESMLVYRHGGS